MSESAFFRSIPEAKMRFDREHFFAIPVMLTDLAVTGSVSTREIGVKWLF
jgi:hypothetical protein